MPRVVAILLGLVLASTSGQVYAMHIHAYTDHDHPEHHHGLAAHEHHRSAPRQDDAAAHFESCDPGQHAVSFAMGCMPLQPAPAIDAESAAPSVFDQLVLIRSVRGLTDVRVHDPPPRTQTASRAPPAFS